VFVRLGVDPKGVRGRLHIRAKGEAVERVLDGHTPFDARPCPSCGVVAAEPEPDDSRHSVVTCRACGVTATQLVKVLPCEHCEPKELTTTLGTGAGRLFAGARLADGSPYIMGSVPIGVKWPWRYKCAECKRTTAITAAEFNSLRLLEPAEYLPLLA